MSPDSLNKPTSLTDETGKIKNLPDRNSPDPCEILCKKEITDPLVRLLKVLTIGEFKIIEAYY